MSDRLRELAGMFLVSKGYNTASKPVKLSVVQDLLVEFELKTPSQISQDYKKWFEREVLNGVKP